jgi:hypothetical protein
MSLPTYARWSSFICAVVAALALAYLEAGRARLDA